MSDNERKLLAEQLMWAADECCQCDDGHHEQAAPYGTDGDVRISRDDARRIASLLAGGVPKPVTEDVIERAAKAVHRAILTGHAGAGMDLALALGQAGYEEFLRDVSAAALSAAAGGVSGRSESEVKAEGWDEAVRECHSLGWLHDFALSDALERNPHRAALADGAES